MKKKIKETLKRKGGSGVVIQSVEFSPSMHEALGLIQNYVNIAHG